MRVGWIGIVALLAVGVCWAADAPGKTMIENAAIAVSVDPNDGTMQVVDRRTGKIWRQRSLGKDIAVKSVGGGDRLALVLRHAPSASDMNVTIAAEGPEVVVSIRGDGKQARTLAWPGPFLSDKGMYLVVPMNEGISYPVDDRSIGETKLVAYGGHGICMGFWGATDGQAGYMGILETPDDAAIRMRRVDDLLCIGPEWESQKGQWGYERRVRYVFFDKGGHVAMAKRYREHAKRQGLLKTLEEKRRKNPNVDRLIGAANIWFWERDPLAMVKEMQAAGIERILWSNRAAPNVIAEMNKIPTVLTSRYDIVQDVMDPENFKFLNGVHSDWPTEAWPKDLMIGANGDWVKGWQVKGKDGQMRPCGVVCDKQAVGYEDKRLGEELKTSPYRCRFIDTTTASPWRECYDKDHPHTRGESRKYKMDLLAVVSGKYNLVTGSETGHEAAVPVVHYFEGMLSLGNYRVPDSGRDIQRIWDQVPENVAKFQVGEKYRLPLWELVFHDCVVAQWYWGDYNNKLPAIWAKRDLFNVLYGTPPMYMFNRASWAKNKDRFVKSYQATCGVARKVGYAEMMDHRFLAQDRSVQQTRFANGVVVTVNFGDTTYRMEDGTDLAAGGFKVSQ